MKPAAIGVSKSSGFGTSGTALFRLVGDRVYVEFPGKDGERAKKFEFSRSALPDVPKFDKDIPNPKELYISLDEGDEKIRRISPLTGTFKVKLVDFSRPDGQDAPPKFFEIDGGKYGKGPQKVFTAFLEVTEGFWKGCIVPARYMAYKFAGDSDGNLCWTFDPNATGQYRSPKGLLLKSLCEVSEILAEPMKFPEDGNILPELLERAKKNPVVFGVTIEKGKVISFKTLEEMDAEL